MRRRTSRILAAALAVLLLPLVGSSSPPPPPAERVAEAPQSLDDERLKDLRTAAATWTGRRGPQRKVLDQVCLVPDVASFLDALATWDRDQYFPILIDDTELAIRFLRAFRPARIIRIPRASPPLEPYPLWDKAMVAVGRTWAAPGTPEKNCPKGDQLPTGLGRTPPGVVVTEPGSPTLAGALALAAGRFQPLIRWQMGRDPNQALPLETAAKLALELEVRVDQLIPQCHGLGDDCDFVTIAGAWPDRYVIPEGLKKGDNALDDVFGRNLQTGARWAFVGRLTGSAEQSVYEAMCSLFLQPESALLYNAFDETESPWDQFRTDTATETLAPALPVERRASRQDTGLKGWHRGFDPINRHGLLLINSSGGEDNFRAGPGSIGKTADVPMSVPAAIHMIHSFSAFKPADPATIAGRWRANGAFLYFGSMNEPYLQAFRTPQLVANLLTQGIPFSAAVRQLHNEGPFGTPWRLMLLGDPLYRLIPRAERPERIGPTGPTTDWPAYSDSAAPTASASDTDRIRWCLQTALLQAARLEGGPARDAWQTVVLGIENRESLPPPMRPVYDALLADLITLARPEANLPWPDRVKPIAPVLQAPALKRAVEARTALGVDGPR